MESGRRRSLATWPFSRDSVPRHTDRDAGVAEDRVDCAKRTGRQTVGKKLEGCHRFDT